MSLQYFEEKKYLLSQYREQICQACYGPKLLWSFYLQMAECDKKRFDVEMATYVSPQTGNNKSCKYPGNTFSYLVLKYTSFAKYESAYHLYFLFRGEGQTRSEEDKENQRSECSATFNVSQLNMLVHLNWPKKIILLC